MMPGFIDSDIKIIKNAYHNPPKAHIMLFICIDFPNETVFFTRHRLGVNFLEVSWSPHKFSSGKKEIRMKSSQSLNYFCTFPQERD